ncbi:MAG: type II toxin-antitoxin system VapC family toxin [Thermoleophilaceae bacterium]
MTGVVADTHALLWMLDGTLPDRSRVAARRIAEALGAKGVYVSIGSFLDLRYLVDSGRRPAQILDDARSIVEGDAFTIVPLDLRVIDGMAAISRDAVRDPFDRIIAATALTADLPLVTADERLRAALGERTVW